MTADSSTKIFISYSHKDEDLLDAFRPHLSLLRRRGMIQTWHDRRIAPGAEWNTEIDDHIYSSQIILLLISSDFIASDYCYDKEMTLALELHESRQARVIPIMMRPTDCRGAPFSKLQMLPKDARPVSKWADRDDAFLDIVTRLSEVLTEHRNESDTTARDVDPQPKPDRETIPERDVIEQLTPSLLRLGLLSLLHGWPKDAPSPDLTQICRRLEIRSRKSAWEALQYLRTAGLVQRVEGKRALYRLSDRGKNVLERLQLVAKIEIAAKGD
ncbi:MAG: TIR domain-containing protein [Acidobacteriota bacterium]